MRQASKKQYWLFKSEPETFSITALAQCPRQTTLWDGVRNYQARNFMRDEMQVGDLGFFYHSNCKAPGIVGTVTITHIQQPDITALDPQSEYYDPKATPDNPRWITVKLALKDIFKAPISLAELKEIPELSDMRLLQKGNRLSVLPILPKEWQLIVSLAK